MFFCCFQLWPLFPSDRLVRCSVESNTDATHIGALKTMFSVWRRWSCYSSDDWWRYWLTTLISSWWLSSQVEGWLSHRRQGENYFADITPTKTFRIVWTLFFVAFNCAFCCWVDDCRRKLMDTLNMAKNSLECHGDKFADVIVCIYWRQVRRSDKYWCYSDLVRIYWKRYLHSSVTRSLKDIMFWYLTSRGWWIFHWTIRVYLDCLSTKDIFAAWTCLKKEAFSWRCTVRIYCSAGFWLMAKYFVAAITVY